jgi:hypothetical protein
MTSNLMAVCAAVLLSALVVPAQGPSLGAERVFERRFPAAGSVTLDVVTNTGRVDVRGGGDSAVVVRGTVKRNVSWRGARVTDEQIAKLREAPPVRAEAGTVRVERIADEALWRGVAIDYEIVVPATARVLVETQSGAVSVAGVRSDVRVETGSGAVRVDVADGAVALRSGSGAIRVAGAMSSLAMHTQSGSIVAEADSVGAVEASSSSGSVTVSGVRGTLRAETGSGQLKIAGDPTGDWAVRSRSGSVSIRVPSESRFDLLARSRSGDIKAGLAVSHRGTPTKHFVEGAVNGGGPKVDVETGSSQITLGV